MGFVFCNVIGGGMEDSPQKVISVNEAQGIGQLSPEPLLSGGVCRLVSQEYSRMLKHCTHKT